MIIDYLRLLCTTCLLSTCLILYPQVNNRLPRNNVNVRETTQASKKLTERQKLLERGIEQASEVLKKPDLRKKIIPDFGKILERNRKGKTFYDSALHCLSTGDTVMAIRLFRESAVNGNINSMCEYGIACLKGIGMMKNIEQGVNYLLKADALNNSKATYLLGCYYYGDFGNEKDSIKAFRYFEKSAEQGEFSGQVRIGDLYYDASDTLNAIKYWEMAHKQGTWIRDINKSSNISSEMLWDMGVITNNLGFLYYNGYGVEKDVKRAIDYYLDGTYCLNPDAAYNMGHFWHDGNEYVKENKRAAAIAIKIAADAGLTDAEAEYGDYCRFGVGMEKDSLQGVYWYKRAAGSGHVGAMNCLVGLYFNNLINDSTILWGTKPECRDSADIQYMVGKAYYNKEDYGNAETWWKLSAAKNDPDALWWMYVLNEMVKKDSITAFEYLKKATKIKIPAAINDMGVHYLEGNLVEKNIEKAKEMFLEAADSGDAVAYRNLGIIYYWKEYGMKNRKLAADYWKRGAELGDTDSQYNYGYILKKGHGVKKDKQEAIRWFKLATQNGSEEAKEELQKMGIVIEPEPVLDTSNTANAIKEEPQPTMKKYHVTGVDFFGITLEEE